MTYIGEIQHGVVVLKDAPPLQDGTVVRVEVEPIDQDRVDGDSADKKPVEKKPRRGSPEAVLQSMGEWHGPPGELDRLLAELHQGKQDELRVQQLQPDDKL